jgi:hypothetical protein
MMAKRKPKYERQLVVKYLGETDPAQFIHSNKTHRSVSEAFRDADYAIAIQRHKSEWDDCVEFLGGLVWIAPAIGFLVYICYLILKGL